MGSSPGNLLSGSVDRAWPGENIGIRTHAVLEASLEEVARLRQELTRPDGEPFPANFLKASDEQTVVALAAVLQACRAPALDGTRFTDWAVLAAPQYLGRLQSAELLHKFDPRTSYRVSPLFVPHTSLHAISGTISMALQIHGRNFGVGGGRQAVVEALLTGLTVLQEPGVKGTWVVCTRCHPEPTPNAQGQPGKPIVCQALALALTPVLEAWEGVRLRWGVLRETGDLRTATDPFAALLSFLQGDAGKAWALPLGWGGQALILERGHRQLLTRVA